jgi:hypothetical protein
VRPQPSRHRNAGRKTAATGNGWRIAGVEHKVRAVAEGLVDRGTATRAADDDLQHLAYGQAEVAAELGAQISYAGRSSEKSAVFALGAEGGDLIDVGGRHREVDEVSGIGEVEQRSARGRPRRGEPEMLAQQATAVSFVFPDVQSAPVTSANETS